MDRYNMERLLKMTEDSQPDIEENQSEQLHEFPVHELNTAQKKEVYRLTTTEADRCKLAATYKTALRLGVIPASTREEVEEFLDTIRPRTEASTMEHISISNMMERYLPVELHNQVLSEVSIEGLIRFRNSSKDGQHRVIVHREYRLMMENAPTLLKALIEMELGSDGRFNLQALAAVLEGSSCQGCNTPGAHGFLLFLPTLTRCCLRCLPQRPNFTVYTIPTKPLPAVAPAARERRLASLRSRFPPNFDPRQVLRFKPLPPVTGKVQLIFRPWHPPPPVLNVSGPEHPAAYGTPPNTPPTALMFLMYRYSRLRRLTWNHERYWCRYMACMIIPHLDYEDKMEEKEQVTRGDPSDKRQELKVQTPRCCNGCYERPQEPPTNGDHLGGTEVFSSDTYMQHFKRCPKAQKIWIRYQRDRLARKSEDSVDDR